MAFARRRKIVREGCKCSRRGIKHFRGRHIHLRRIRVSVISADDYNLAVQQRRRRMSEARVRETRPRAHGPRNRIENISRSDRRRSIVSAHDQDAPILKQGHGMLCSRRGHHSRGRERAERGIEYFYGRADCGAVLPPGHGYAPVRQHGRRRARARFGHAKADARPGICYGIINFGRVGGAPTGGDTAGHQNAPVLQCCRDMFAARIGHRGGGGNCAVGVEEISAR